MRMTFATHLHGILGEDARHLSRRPRAGIFFWRGRGSPFPVYGLFFGGGGRGCPPRFARPATGVGWLRLGDVDLDRTKPGLGTGDALLGAVGGAARGLLVRRGREKPFPVRGGRRPAAES